jgi:hypothetical protein
VSLRCGPFLLVFEFPFAGEMNFRVYQTILHSITAFTLVVQFYVIWLVQKKSPASMREYRFFLILFTVSDFGCFFWLDGGFW